MPDMREEFEEYIAVVREAVKAKGFKPLDDAIEKWMFHAWQASRAALKVELPEQLPPAIEVAGKMVHTAKDAKWNACLERVKEALQQAGIEVVK